MIRGRGTGGRCRGTPSRTRHVQAGRREGRDRAGHRRLPPARGSVWPKRPRGGAVMPRLMTRLFRAAGPGSSGAGPFRHAPPRTRAPSPGTRACRGASATGAPPRRARARRGGHDRPSGPSRDPAERPRRGLRVPAGERGSALPDGEPEEEARGNPAGRACPGATAAPVIGSPGAPGACAAAGGHAARHGLHRGAEVGNTPAPCAARHAGEPHQTCPPPIPPCCRRRLRSRRSS